MDLSGMGSSELLPTLKDLYLPAVIAALYWVFKRTASPLVARSILFFKLLRYRELKLVKKIRADKLKIARELHKESALYVSFLLSAVVSIGLIILPIQTGPRSIYDKIIIFFIYMAPVLILEAMWIWKKSFIDTLIDESEKLPSNYRRTIIIKGKNAVRSAAREKRRIKIKSKIDKKYRKISPYH